MSRFAIWTLAAFLMISANALAQSQSQDNRPPRSDDSATGESSSKDTRIDLAPPKGDASMHPGSELPTDVNEMRRYDPHKADKDVEVGDYHFKRKNYRAAVSRYRGALSWKPDDAEATYKLALSEEKLGDLAAARQDYESYLRILPHGPYAEDSKKAIARLPQPPDAQPGTKATAENTTDSSKPEDKKPN
jgi:tetratricopeptide (TPR) repeat protein